MENITKSNFKEKINNLHVQEPWFTLIKDGLKTVEGRKGNSTKYKNWENNYAVFYNDDNAILVLVKNVRHYNNLDDYLTTENLNDVAPHLNQNYDLIKSKYHVFNTDEAIKKDGGFNGIEIEMIKKLD